jgi:Glycosyl hydrolase family 26
MWALGSDGASSATDQLQRCLCLYLNFMMNEERMMNSKLKTLVNLLVISLLVVMSAACSELSDMPTRPGETSTNGTGEPLSNAMFGAYIKGAAWNKDVLFDLEGAVEHEFKIIHWFTSWDAPFEGDLVERVLALGRIPMITWQSRNQSVTDIATGVHDVYIRTWAKAVSEISGDVYLRPFPEMNGNWTPWNGNPKALISAWQRVVKIFREEGATNAKWVWSPNVRDEPATKENSMELYYPGSQYVDVLALDGYNWGTTRSYTAWKEFDTIFQESYGRVTALGNQRVWVAEVASTENGGDKGEWVKNMLASTSFPRIEALVWFNEKKETDWRMESSSDSLSAFKQGLSDEDPTATLVASH